MAIHASIPSMLKESLVEMFLVAQDCINFRKDQKIWGSGGCYGYPAAVLLFSIADAIGSYVIGGSTKDHFEILNHNDFYDLGLSRDELKIVYENYRCLLTHNAAMPMDTMLDIGNPNDSVFSIENSIPIIRVVPFLEVTRISLTRFLKDVDKTVGNSQQLNKIINKKITFR